MIKVTIPASELFDERTGEFLSLKKDITLSLEHSLVSISKWEAKWHKPFISKDPKTKEELLDYVRCMTLTPNVDPNVYNFINNNVLQEIVAYIDDSQTATWFSEDKKPPSREIITSEVSYYWMVALQIPFECQKWHLNRLLTLVRICNIKNQPDKHNRKMTAKERSALNKARRAKHRSRG